MRVRLRIPTRRNPRPGAKPVSAAPVPSVPAARS